MLLLVSFSTSTFNRFNSFLAINHQVPDLTVAAKTFE